MEYEPVKVEPQEQRQEQHIRVVRSNWEGMARSTASLYDWDDATLRAQLNQAVPGLSDAQLGRAVFALREESVDPMAFAGFDAWRRIGEAIGQMDSGVDMRHVMGDIERARLNILASPSQGLRNVDELAKAIAGSDGNSKSSVVTAAAEWVDNRARLMRIQGIGAPRGPAVTR